MNIRETSLPGVLLINPDVHGDERGFFMELWNESRAMEKSLHLDFKQDNISRSARGVLRGLHLQNPRPQGKLITILEGTVFDVAVDLRRGSPTFGQWEGFTLDSVTKQLLYIPEGLAHGFMVLSESALFLYKCTDTYHPPGEFTLLWNDPDVGISWPAGEPRLSDKDRRGLLLRDIPRDQLLPFHS